MSKLRAGDMVEFTIKARVDYRLQSGRIKLTWHSGEEIVSELDSRLDNE